MIKNVLTSIAMLMCFSNASAGFVPETWTNTGQSPLESYVNLYPIGADAGQQWFKPLSFPDVVNISAGTMTLTVGQPVEIAATVTFLPNELGINFTRMERGARDTYTQSQGQWIFSVTDPTQTVASGYLGLLSSGINTENGIVARLFDMTAQTFLFQSSQYDYGHDKTYQLGELVGNRGANFSGSLENTLQSGHIYLFDYLILSGNNGAGDFGSSAIGAFSLSAVSPVPEPSTLALLALGLAGLSYCRRKH